MIVWDLFFPKIAEADNLCQNLNLSFHHRSSSQKQFDLHDLEHVTESLDKGHCAALSDVKNEVGALCHHATSCNKSDLNRKEALPIFRSCLCPALSVTSHRSLTDFSRPVLQRKKGAEKRLKSSWKFAAAVAKDIQALDSFDIFSSLCQQNSRKRELSAFPRE